MDIHLDYGPNVFEPWALEIRYGYPHSGEHQVREQVLRIPKDEIKGELAADVKRLYASLERRIPEPELVRLPHAEIKPHIRPTGLTYVVLDQARAEKMPVARLYYLEEVEPIKSRIERRIYLEKPDWDPDETELCKRVRAAVRKLAWEDYSRLVDHHLFDS